MNIKKQIGLEIVLYFIFLISNLVLYRGINFFSNFWISFASISFVLIINISLLGFYASIKSSRNNTFVFVLIHFIIIFLFVFLYNVNLLNILIIIITGFFITTFFGSFLKQIEI